MEQVEKLTETVLREIQNRLTFFLQIHPMLKFNMSLHFTPVLCGWGDKLKIIFYNRFLKKYIRK